MPKKDESVSEFEKLRKKLREGVREGSRAAAAKDLGKMGPEAKKAIPDLLEAMKNDPSERVRGRAALALGRIGDLDTVSAVVKIMLEDKDAQVRSRAAWALGDYGPTATKAIEPLYAAAKEERNAERKFYFLISLVRIEQTDGEAYKEILRMKKDGELL